MKTLSSQSTFNQVKSTARVLGLDICEANIGFELWRGDTYKGGFASLDGVIVELNLLLGIAEAKAAEEAEAFQKRQQEQKEKFSEQQEISNKIAAMLAGATEAALIHNGLVIGSCKTTAKNGSYIDIASTTTGEGTPVNSRLVKVSRSEKNIKKAQEAPLYLPKLFNEDLFYVK